MSHLTAEQLDLLTRRINRRLAEFEAGLPTLPAGIVRVAHDVIDEWWNELDTDSPAPKPDTVDDALAARGILQDAYHAGYSRGKAAANPPAPDTTRLVTNSAPESPPKTEEKLTKPESPADALAAHWPDMPDLEGVDRFAEHPVTGAEPAPSNGNGHARPDAPAVPRRGTAKPAANHPWVTAPTLDGRTPPRSLAQARPPLPDPNIAREQLAHALAIGSNGSLAAALTRPAHDVAEEEDAEERAEKAASVREQATRRDQARQAELQAILVALQKMAVDGQMPKIEEWNEERPNGLPSAETLLRRYDMDSWGDLAKRAGLAYFGKGHPPHRARRIQNMNGHPLVGRDAFLAELRRQAMGGVAPSQSAFNLAKPAVWPTASAFCQRLETSWADLAVEAGLTPNSRPERRAVPA